MLNRDAAMRKIKERMQGLKPSDLCALFLISLREKESENTGSKQAEDKYSELISDVFARFFRQTDIAGDIGNRRYAIFIAGSLTEKTIYEKINGIVQSLRLAFEENGAGEIKVTTGVYLSSIQETDYEDLSRKAEYALEMAKKNKNCHYYIYTSPDIWAEREMDQAASASSQMMLHYIDEGVRIFEAGDSLKPIYVSPGFYRRLSLDEEISNIELVQIHPDDIEAYESYAWETVRTGKPGNTCYRISPDGRNWISCRVRFLRITGGSKDRKPIIIEISHNTEGLERLKEQLDEKKEWLSFVADQTDYQLWEVDVRSRVFRMLYTNDLLEGRHNIYQDFPESLIESGRIHSGSAEAFRAFGWELLSGRMQNSGNFMIQYRQTSCYGWAAMSYHLLCDENGSPVKAIGIKEDLSYIPWQQSRFMQRRIMPSDMYSNLYCFLQANLTYDTVEKLLLEGRERIRLLQYQTYDEIIDKGISRLFSEEDVKRFRKKFNREYLLNEFDGGRCWIYEKCRIVDFDGSIRWVSIGVNLNRDQETGDVCLYAYLNRRDRRAEWEKKLQGDIQTDPYTGLYTYETTEKLIRSLLSNNRRHTCTLVQLSIEGAGELFADGWLSQKEQDIATALHVLLNTDCLAGWKDERSLLVFFPDSDTSSQIRRRLENAFSFARISLSGMREMKFIRFVAGAVSKRSDDFVLKDMLSSVAGLCVLHAGEAADTVDFCQEKETYFRNDLVPGDLNTPEESHELTTSHILTEEDKDMALECMELMLSSESAKDSLNGILCKIGQYYQADRVYILMLTEGKQIMTMLNEWVGPGKYNIQHSISGKKAASFPVIANYAVNPAQVILTRQTEDKSSWQYAIFPMESDKDSEQMLCIENPRKDMRCTALIQKLLPYLIRERKRIRDVRAQDSLLDRFFAMSDLDACMEALYSIDSDEYSSLGVMMVDVPEYDKLKELRGFEFARQFLLHISEILREAFDKSLLFHTHETEFLVLCTDVVYHSFLNLCARAKQMIGRQYTGLYRVGITWSDGVFRARDLVKKARSIMECDNPGEFSPTDLRAIQEQNYSLEKDVMAKLQAEGQMTIYIQPKIDMRDGSLMGAEALVRILDKDGKLLSHSRIIEDMEKEGTIQKLDYFVFDRMLDSMSQWQKKGYPLYPMSSNFSRYTLLNSSVLASVLAVMSRYPQVPQELIELEITETAGDFENNTFEEQIRRFGEYGLRFSLDDFGSGYSNVTMLSELKFHSVKLDRGLIKNITENTMTRMIVKDLVHICESCGMLCVAEGVENQTQADMLLEDGCICAQGFYYDRPMSLESFEEKYLRPIKKEIHK